MGAEDGRCLQPTGGARSYQRDTRLSTCGYSGSLPVTVSNRYGDEFFCFSWVEDTGARIEDTMGGIFKISSLLSVLEAPSMCRLSRILGGPIPWYL